MRSFLPVLSLCLLLAHVRAVSFDVHVRSRPSTLNRRATGDHITPVANTHNAEYIANVTLGGREIPVLLDTGSSDLWVTGSVPNSKDLGKSVSLSYAVGTAAGDIYTAAMEFANYSVTDQAFLLVKDTSSFSVNITSQGYEGLIGLGPNTGSVIRDKIDDASGDSVLGRIFSLNTTSANYLTVLLNRLDDPDSPATGHLTISEPLSQYTNITSMPKLSVEKVHKLTDEDQHWQVYTDANGVIGPDGNPIDVDSIVPSAPDRQLVVVFDSGFTLPQVPREMADQIYGRVQGAEYDTDSEVWTIPCDQYLNMSFKFGGVDYPIHPLDISSSDFNLVNSVGDTVCLGTFQPITSAFSLLGEYDIILGMAFMRNVYTLLDYGNFMENTAVDRGDPFVQLLPLTNAATAKEDFIQVRLNGVDTTGSSSKALLPASEMQHSPESEEEKKKKYEEMILSRWPYIFVGCLAFVLIVAGVIIWRCCIVRRRRKAAATRAAALLPNTAPPARSPGPHQGSFQMQRDEMEMRQSLRGYESSPYRGSGYHGGAESRPSFASSRTRL